MVRYSLRSCVYTHVRYPHLHCNTDVKKQEAEEGEKRKRTFFFFCWVNEPAAELSLPSSSSWHFSPFLSPLLGTKAEDRALPSGSTWRCGINTVCQLRLQIRSNKCWQVSWCSGKQAIGLKQTQQTVLGFQTPEGSMALANICSQPPSNRRTQSPPLTSVVLVWDFPFISTPANKGSECYLLLHQNLSRNKTRRNEPSSRQAVSWNKTSLRAGICKVWFINNIFEKGKLVVFSDSVMVIRLCFRDVSKQRKSLLHTKNTVLKGPLGIF